MSKLDQVYLLRSAIISYQSDVILWRNPVDPAVNVRYSGFRPHGINYTT